MTVSELEKISQQLKKQRVEKGWTVAEAASKCNVSPATISRMENGKKCVGLQKYRDYAKVLGYNLHERGDLKNLNEFRNQLEMLEDQIEFGYIDESLKELDRLKTELPESYLQLVHFLKAKAHFYSKQNNQAQSELYTAIDQAKKYFEEFKHLNILGCSYNMLANICYRNHNFTGALTEAQEGINWFYEDGERKAVYHMLLINKATYLVKLGRINEADETIDYLISIVHEINKASIRAKVYELKALADFEKKRYREALRWANKGRKIAVDEKLSERYFELMTLIGDINCELEQEDEAERSYLSALKVEEKINDKAIVATTYLSLGSLSLKRRQTDQAKQCFEKSLSLCEDSGYTGPRYVESLMAISDFLYQQGQAKEAIPPSQKALELAQQQNLTVQEDIALNIALYYEGIDDQKALHYFRLYKMLHNQ